MGADFWYTFLNYYSNPELGELSSRMSIALVVFPAQPDEAALLCIDYERIAAVGEFGRTADVAWIRQFVDGFHEGLITCRSPEMVILKINDALAKESDVLRFSKTRKVWGTSKEEVKQILGFGEKRNLPLIKS